MTDDLLRTCDLDFDAYRAIGVMSGRYTLAEALSMDAHLLQHVLPGRLRREVFALQCRGALSFATPFVPPDTSCVSCGLRSACRCGRDDLEFTVEVDFTDRTRHEGGFVVDTRMVDVLAPTDDVAVCLAAQVVSCLIPADSMVTATRVVLVAA